MAVLFQPGMRLWWKITAAIYLVAAMGLTGYWLVTESGLVRILIEAQAGDRGTWYPKITALVTLLALMVPLIVLRFLLPVKLPAPIDPEAPNLMRWR
jgi:hypothetical protein